MSDKIFVTGGAGFIGSNLIRFLLRETDHHVINVDCLTYAGHVDSLADVQSSPRYEFEKVDIADRAAVRDLFQKHSPTRMMHLAAESHVDRSIVSPDVCVQTNIVGTANLLEAARSHFQTLSAEQKKAFRFHHVSTDEVYGSLQPQDPPFTETSRYQPSSPYSASKASSDHLVRAWHTTFGLPVIVSHCSNNYGPYQFVDKLIPVVILRALQGQPIPVYGGGQNVRDWLFVEDHVHALYRVMMQGQTGSTYNIGGNNERRNIDLVRTICQLMEEFLPIGDNPAIDTSQICSYSDLIQFVQDRPGHDFRYAMNTQRMKQELGWEPLTTGEDGFRKTVKWYLDNIDWCERVRPTSSLTANNQSNQITF